MTIAGTNYGAIDAPEALHQIGPVHHTSARLAPSFSPGLHVMYSALEVMVEHAPSRYASTLRRVVCESDAVTLERDDVVDAVVDSARECFRQGAQGLVHDSLMVHRTWPFDVSAITPPVHFVQGSADTLVPPEVNRPVYDAIPNALWHEYRDEGHFVAVTQAADLFGILAV